MAASLLAAFIIFFSALWKTGDQSTDLTEHSGAVATPADVTGDSYPVVFPPSSNNSCRQVR